MSRIRCIYIKEDGHGVDMSRIRCIYIKEDGHGVDMGREREPIYETVLTLNMLR